jgi:hypothetical protein
MNSCHVPGPCARKGLRTVLQRCDFTVLAMVGRLCGASTPGKAVVRLLVDREQIDVVLPAGTLLLLTC